MGVQRNVFVSGRVQQKRHRKRVIFIVSTCAGFGVFIGLLIFLARLDSLHIKNIQVEGAHTELETQIRSTIDKHLSENFLWVFPRWNRFLFQKSETQAELLSTYPKIQTVRVNYVGLSGLDVSVEERKMFGLWCDGVAPVSAGSDANVGNCYAIDSTGYIFATSPYFSDHTYFDFFGKPLNQAVQDDATTTTGMIPVYEAPYIGAQYLPHDVFAAVNGFVGMLKEKGIITDTLIVHDLDFFELALKSGGVVRFSPSQDLSKAASDLKTGLEKNITGQPNKKLSDIEYIDLRFTNKVIFKFIE